MRVNALCPGPVNTPLLQELFAKDPEKAAKRMVHLPMGRFAEPDEIARSALFLASDDSTYVNASTFLVDGGLSAAYLTPGQAYGANRRRVRTEPRSAIRSPIAFQSAIRSAVSARIGSGSRPMRTASLSSR